MAGEWENIISRADAAALIPEEAAKEIIQGVPEQSAALQIMRRLPNMTRRILRMPVLSFLPTAYFVTGEADTDGAKQTAEVKWENKYITAEEIACIVPIPEQVLADVDYDIWSEISPRIQEAIGKVIDLAVFFGTGKPSSWPTAILTAAGTAGNNVAVGTGEDLYEDILGENGYIGLVEADGFFVDKHVAALTMRSKLRGVRSSDGIPIFKTSLQDPTRYELDGASIIFPRNGGFTPGSALMISGDSQQAVYSIRQDITYKLLTEAVIQDDAGAIVFNLAQQDMVALRVTFRMGWQIPNPINAIQGTEASRYPFGALTP